ncbi:MAG: hypothetical protein PSN37_01305 [Alphaproteobacteria bacterium]|nr:hypothetical protein [Alphaproteobacteria bacterium]
MARFLRGSAQLLLAAVDCWFPFLGSQADLIVPRFTVLSRALLFVTGIMSFLACLSLSGVMSVNKAARGWVEAASQEVTVQLMPLETIDPDEQVARVFELIEATPGVIVAHLYGEEEMRGLLEPWLGKDFALDLLPVPRLLALRLEEDAGSVDLSVLGTKLRQVVPGAMLDNHQFWRDRIRFIARCLELVGLFVLMLIFTATGAIIIFATRSAMDNSRDILEMLYLFGADRSFISRQFERHFLKLGIQGGMIGGGIAAILIFLFTWIVLSYVPESAGDGRLAYALAPDWESYLGILSVTLVLSIVSMLVSRITVHNYLKSIY